jgi:uncharacterized protein involved in response to NO
MEARIPPILQTGFRPFFLAAMIYSVLSMSIWTAQLLLDIDIPFGTVDRMLWHGHEMLFGYAMAVIAGFLLTAVQNWTGGKTAQGRELLIMFLLWFVARLFSLYPTVESAPAMLLCSTLFYLLFLRALLRPLIEAGNEAQWGIIGKLILLLVVDAVFLLTTFGGLDAGFARPALLVGVYTVIGLILVMAHRVVASFTRNAISAKDRVREYPHLPMISLAAFLVFAVADVLAWQVVLLVSGLLAFATNALRLYGWYTPEIWTRPLVWVLHMAVMFITLGFLLRGAAHELGIPPSIGLHAMTYGGIGLITTGMMARVALGHTGRNVFDPPSGILMVFLLLTVGAVVRVLLPLMMMDHYFMLIQISQVLWILAFLVMLIHYFRPLVSARVDGRYG